MVQIRERLTRLVATERKTAPTSVSMYDHRSPADSHLSATVPLSDRNYPLRLKYRASSDRVRVGRILEDLDTIAGIASYKHNLQLKTVLKNNQLIT